jgi:hypothetical protein
MPSALRTNREKRAPLPPAFQNTLGFSIGLYLIISLIATTFQVESAWTWPVDILDLASHMVSNYCIFPTSHG